MPYERVLTEFGWKIIGEDTGEYAEIREQFPEAQQINLTATGKVVVSDADLNVLAAAENQMGIIPENLILQPSGMTIGQWGNEPFTSTPLTMVSPGDASRMSMNDIDMLRFSVRDIIDLLKFLFGG